MFTREELEIIEAALARHKPTGRLAAVLALIGKVHQEIARRRLVEGELGKPTGETRLYAIPQRGS